MAVQEEEQWSIAGSAESLRCINHIRALTDGNIYVANPEKTLLKLNVGDPTAFGNLPASPIALQAVADVVLQGASHGYQHSTGRSDAKQAVAEKFSFPNNPVTANGLIERYTASAGSRFSIKIRADSIKTRTITKDVFITSGCSQAMEFVLLSLCDAGSNLLMSRPGYPLYRTFSDSRQVECRLFNLLPERSWEADVDHMETLIDANTKLIVLVNPSNPCGSAHSKENLLQIVDVAERHHLPILVDEVYGDIVYNGGAFHPMASLTNRVPIFSCSSLTKKYLVPGWRTGWLIVYDQHHHADEIRTSIQRVSAKILGSCSVIQAALPRIFRDVPEEFFHKTTDHLEAASNVVFSGLSKIPCMRPIKPAGAMYMLVGIDFDQLADLKDDHDFTRVLMAEESVFLLPASLFQYPGYVRIVLLAPVEMMMDAVQRIDSFCRRHMSGQ